MHKGENVFLICESSLEKSQSNPQLHQSHYTSITDSALYVPALFRKYWQTYEWKYSHSSIVCKCFVWNVVLIRLPLEDAANVKLATPI